MDTPTTQTNEVPSPAAAAEAMRSRIAQAYAMQSRESRQEQWILEYLPMVHHIVQKLRVHLPDRADVEDLVSAGTLGLVKAARAYDPAHNAEFKTYAYIRIRGSVIDELRRRSFVPQNVHKQVRQIQHAWQQLSNESGGPPSDEALAERAGISLRQLYRTLEEARRLQFLSIHGLGEPGAEAPLTPVDQCPSPVDQASRQETIARLAQAMTELPQRDRMVLILYYERDLTMKEAAEVLGVTESRVSQMHASALFKLAMKLGSPS